jgi:hypothetical protein
VADAGQDAGFQRSKDALMGRPVKPQVYCPGYDPVLGADAKLPLTPTRKPSALRAPPTQTDSPVRPEAKVLGSREWSRTIVSK